MAEPPDAPVQEVLPQPVPELQSDGSPAGNAAPSSSGDRSAAPVSAGADGQDSLIGVQRELRAFRELFDEHVRRNDIQRKAFDALHEELQGYRNAFLLNQLQKPVISTLLSLYDSFLRLEDALPAAGGRERGPSPEEFQAGVGDFVRSMESFRLELLEVLARLDVVSYDERLDTVERERLQRLDRKLHKPVNVEATSDPERHNEIVRVLRHGFYWGDRVFRPEEVVILRYRPVPPSDGGSDDG